MKKVAFYGSVLIGTYLVVYYYTGAGALIKDASSGGAQLVQAFQARGSSGSSAYPS